MAITVAVSHPAFPDGQEFGIDHLGAVPNNGSLEVPEENERIFINVKGMTLEDAFKNNEVVSISGSTSVDDAAEIIGDREPPGPEQGVVVPDENKDENENENAEQTPTKSGRRPQAQQEDTQVIPQQGTQQQGEGEVT